MTNYRTCCADDIPHVKRVFKDAVLNIGAHAYSAEQVRVWAAFADDPLFEDQLKEGITLVAEQKEQIVGFGQLHPLNHIALLYVDSHYANMHIGSELAKILERKAEESGMKAVSVEASKIARPFFEKQGYTVLEKEVIDRNGVEFERFLMHKRICDGIC
ncbi:MAG TPA: GNAT family N-acetyltransferase [Gammaproteobacteria bacterium]